MEIFNKRNGSVNLYKTGTTEFGLAYWFIWGQDECYLDDEVKYRLAVRLYNDIDFDRQTINKIPIIFD